MAEHTPGPWLCAIKPSAHGWPVVATGGTVICTLNYVQHSMIDPEVPGDRAFNMMAHANGRLIAAAPDLLEQLREAVAWAESEPSDNQTYREAIAKMKGIVAKATGGAP